MKKIILDLCGGTGAWSRPYLEAGYEVHNITLPKYDVRDFQLKPTDKIYGIFAAPPCTMFSIARKNAKTPPDFEKGMEIVLACLKIIWQAQLNHPLKFWALENPRGFLRKFLGKPKYTFAQWEFGGKLSKYTDIWGYFNPPAKKVKIKPTGIDIDKEWQKPIQPDWIKEKLNRTEIRAITYESFARAFFRANQ